MEELIKYLEEKKLRCKEEIDRTDFLSNNSLLNCHKLASKIEAYNEIIDHINMVDYIDHLKNN